MQAVVRPYVMAGVALAGAGLIAVTPIAPPPDLRVTSAGVRLTSGEDLLGSLTSFDPLGSVSGLANDLGSLANIGGVANDLGSLANLGDLGGLFDSGSPLNIPYNLFADLVNIPFYESEALQEYAYALGPAGTVGGVADWIPPGATVANGGVEMVNGLPYYALGGTGSWYMESIGNTWGWDDGNWPQLDGLLHFILPFQFTESLAEQIQTFAQAELIDGAGVNCEFECANVLGYLGGWLHGATPLLSLLNGTTFPTVLADTIGANSATGVINVAPPIPPGTDVIWSGEPAQLNPLAPLEAIANNLTASPAANPIQFPDPTNVTSSFGQLFNDLTTNFNPFATGSYLYWGAPTDYSIPALLAGLLQNFTGIPNQFLIPPFQPFGAEPLSGYTDGPSSLLTGLPEGFQYLVQGLLGYLNPNIYLEAINNDLSFFTNPTALLNAIPLIGYLFDPSSLGLGSFDPTTLLGSFDPSSLGLGSFDPTTLLGSFDPTTLLGSFDPTTLLGTLDPTALATDLSTLLPSAAANLGAFAPDLALQLLTAF